jgi:hypothetical protein
MSVNDRFRLIRDLQFSNFNQNDINMLKVNTSKTVDNIKSEGKKYPFFKISSLSVLTSKFKFDREKKL